MAKTENLSALVCNPTFTFMGIEVSIDTWGFRFWWMDLPYRLRLKKRPPPDSLTIWLNEAAESRILASTLAKEYEREMKSQLGSLGSVVHIAGPTQLTTTTADIAREPESVDNG